MKQEQLELGCMLGFSCMIVGVDGAAWRASQKQCYYRHHILCYKTRAHHEVCLPNSELTCRVLYLKPLLLIKILARCFRERLFCSVFRGWWLQVDCSVCVCVCARTCVMRWVVTGLQDSCPGISHFKQTDTHTYIHTHSWSASSFCKRNKPAAEMSIFTVSSFNGNVSFNWWPVFHNSLENCWHSNKNKHSQSGKPCDIK